MNKQVFKLVFSKCGLAAAASSAAEIGAKCEPYRRPVNPAKFKVNPACALTQKLCVLGAKGEPFN